MNSIDEAFRQLLNDAVDAELGERRDGPAPLGPQPAGSVPAQRVGDPGPRARWQLPLAAASILGLIAAAAIVAITLSQRGGVTGPAAGPIISIPTTTGTAPANRFGRYPEAAELTGIAVGPVSAQVAAHARPALVELAERLPARPALNTPYQVALRYVATSADAATSVLAVSVHNVATSHCPPTFLAHAGHSYVVTCTITLARGSTARLDLEVPDTSSNSGGWSFGLNLG